ncbi:MAG: hypothetical protein KDI37_15950 [Xanthomonadales bacterium]|nr:hypothetical protein [Xanthomonadales bacterium]MCB1627510.1 hypothetical protein [Xanthomonadales bacterium]MCB1634885.1 hypothetical protein [Xanthomonadales bacterium]MCB1643222.1 hypothetical protein [Xanthomonadales bacterium]
MSDNLLQYFLLSAAQTIKLHAEILKPVPQNAPCQARVELKLMPARHEADASGSPSFVLGIRLACDGFPPGSQDQERLFALELVVNLIYTQSAGEPISFEHFVQHHGTLARQAYPLLQTQANGLLQQLGLGMVRLPLDIMGSPPQDSTVRLH